MNKILALVLGLGFAASANAAIIAGDVISIDFGDTATAEANWNTSVTASTTDLVRLSDGTNTDVDLAIAAPNGGPFAAWPNFLDGSAQGGSSVSTIYSDGIINAGTGRDTITLAFTGLDNSLTYNLFAGGVTPASDFGADWDISTSADGGTNQETRFQNTNSYVSFTGITSVSGTFTLTITDLTTNGAPADGRNIGLAELTLTAVPEPSALALLGLGLGAVVLLRRRLRG